MVEDEQSHSSEHGAPYLTRQRDGPERLTYGRKSWGWVLGRQPQKHHCGVPAWKVRGKFNTKPIAVQWKDGVVERWCSKREGVVKESVQYGFNSYLLSNYVRLDQPEELFVGNSQLCILGYGIVMLRITGELFQVNNVASRTSIPTLPRSTSSFKRDTIGILLQERYSSKTIICFTKRVHRQPVLEYNELPKSSFAASSSPRTLQSAEASLWHNRLGHLNADALQHAVENTMQIGANLPPDLGQKLGTPQPSFTTDRSSNPLTKKPRSISFINGSSTKRRIQDTFRVTSSQIPLSSKHMAVKPTL